MPYRDTEYRRACAKDRSWTLNSRTWKYFSVIKMAITSGNKAIASSKTSEKLVAKSSGVKSAVIQIQTRCWSEAKVSAICWLCKKTVSAKVATLRTWKQAVGRVARTVKVWRLLLRGKLLFSLRSDEPRNTIERVKSGRNSPTWWRDVWQRT